ncbi:LOW QUALITY PROTEIN: O-glucosyltransferase rumi homolog [Uranotaenia lowii]|uniref:LOW QUALITY PROTEIN: O-glucosyltransferase rumi homolog n=1 Tax=Uranotaenia lowii TaxID=190385 RepID=UPI002479C3B1|nr:LOW QUALITY PROTEIN: O-glucosyltransferase rumi homolog [Uranotaenia lowii]
MKNLTEFLVIIILLFGTSDGDDGMCMAKEPSCSDAPKEESTVNLYKDADNKYIRLIEEAIASYEPCYYNNTCYLDTLKKDLKPFASGISKQMIDRAASYGTKYQIIDHRLYRQKDCMFPARCSGVEHFIKPLLTKLPDMELVINCRDWPQISRYWNQKDPLPVLSFSKTDEYLDIMYPTWGFWEGGPAISLYPTGLGRWDEHRSSVQKAAKKWPWESKKNQAFFRGSRTSEERDPLVLLSRSNPELVDAQYTKNQAWKSPQDTLNAEPAQEIRLEGHCQYKYLFNFRGVAASFRFKHLFLCKSLVFHVGDEWQEFFYQSLKPWVHYVPVPVGASQQDLSELIKFFIEHEQLAREMAIRGFRHIWYGLKMEDVESYWRKLLKRYGKLINYKVKRDPQLMEV